jgi:putative ABC transport system permease protein
MSELRHAVRRLLRARGFTLAAVVTLALGIGATTAIVTLANALFLRPLPYRDAERLVHLWEVRASKNYGRSETSFPNFEDWRASSRTVELFAGYGWPRVTLRGTGGAEQLQAARVSDTFFDVLGTRAQLGRTFVRGEDVANGPRVAILSDALWRRRFGADANILGRAINVDGVSYEVVGVLSPTFHFAPSRGAELWVPLQPNDSMRTRRQMRWVNVIARLKPGVTAEAADRELDAIAAQLAQRHPDSNAGASVDVVPLREQLTGPVRGPVVLLGIAALFVLLIACVNVASLMIGRVAARRHDVAVRFALGATRASVARSLVVEALVLSAAGAIAGAFVGVSALRAMVMTVPPDLLALMPYLRTLTVDARVLAVVCLAVAACAVLIGVWPAIRASREYHFGGRGIAAKRTLRSALVVGEIALALVLLTGAALTLLSLAALAAVDPGYRAENVLTLRVAFPGDRYDNEAKLAAVQRRVLDALPGAAMIDKLPSLGGGTISFTTAADSEKREANVRAITPRYFEVMSVPLLRGRDFDARDTLDVPLVAIVNRELARRYLRTDDPVGRTLRIGNNDLQIVGVAGDERIGPLDEPVTPVLYLALTQAVDDSVAIVVKNANATDVVRTLQQIDADIAVAGVAPMTAIVASSPSVFLRRATSVVVAAFAAVSLLLALVGLYAVIAEAVTSRTREIAVRVSIGAKPGEIVALIARDGARLGLLGVGIGVAGGLVLTRSMESLLFGVGVHDPLAFGGTSILLLATAVAASLIPALRATRIDPAVALRQE